MLYHGCSAYKTVVPGSISVVQDTTQMSRVVFQVFRTQESYSMWFFYFGCSVYNAVASGSIPDAENSVQTCWAVFRVFRIQRRCFGQNPGVEDTIQLGSKPGIQNSNQIF